MSVCRKKMDVGCKARLERRLRELYRERMRTHEHRLDEWRRQQAARTTLHTEQSDTVRRGLFDNNNNNNNFQSG